MYIYIYIYILADGQLGLFSAAKACSRKARQIYEGGEVGGRER